MSEVLSIDLTGSGDHVLRAGASRTWITLNRVLLTCSSPDNTVLSLSWKSDSDIKLGPFYMQNGGTLTLPAEANPLMRCPFGESLVLCIDGTGTIGGSILIDWGQS